MAGRLSTKQRADCVKYKLLGSCDAGKKCSFRHVKARTTYTEYVLFPEQVPISMAVGRDGSNLRSIMQAGNLQSNCIVVPCECEPVAKVEVVATDQQTLDKAVKNLRVLFSQLYLIGPSWCYFQTEGITADVLLEFREYGGQIPTRMYHVKRTTKMYEICTQQQVSCGASANADTSLEDFEKLNPKCSTLDSMDKLHLVLDSVIEGRSPTDKIERLPARSHMRARIMLEYKKHIKTQLQGALEWMRKPENKQPGFTAKLEGRFGKILWFNLPEDVLASDDPLDVKTFAEFVFSNTNLSQLFCTEVKSENASSLRSVLKDDNRSTTVMETYDLKFVSNEEKVDLRLRNNSGRLEVVMAKKNERKVVVFDMLCLHMNHDIRLSLNRFKTVPKRDSTIQKLLGTLSMPKPGTLKFIPRADEWSVNFIRHKQREVFFLEEKYMVTVTTVMEHCVNWREMRSGVPINVAPEDYDKPRIEIEFHNIIWECMFGKAVGLSPEQSLVLFMETPAISSKVDVSLIPPDPWDVGVILRDMDEVFEHLDTLNELLSEK